MGGSRGLVRPRGGAAWETSPAALVAAFDAALPRAPGVERRAMFGYPCAFVDGRMFTGLHERNLLVRLPDDERARLLAAPGARRFEPWPGRVMREYVAVPPAMQSDAAALRRWMARALAYARTLPPKPARPRARRRNAP